MNEKRKAGRPAKVTEEAKTARPDPSNRANRPTRSKTYADGRSNGPLSMAGDLDDKNYHYRVVTDKGNRVEQLKQYGYEVDQNNNLDFMSGSAVKTGSAHSVVVDKRTGEKGVLMRQPIEFHEEDKLAKAKAIDKTEESMFRKLKTEDGRYGEVEQTNSLAKHNDD